MSNCILQRSEFRTVVARFMIEAEMAKGRAVLEEVFV